MNRSEMLNIQTVVNISIYFDFVLGHLVGGSRRPLLLNT